MKFPTVIAVLTGCASMCAVAGLFSRYDWFCELCSHFYIQYGVCIAIAVAILVFSKRYKFALTALPVLALCAYKILPLYFPDETPEAVEAKRFTVANCNVNVANRQYDKVVAWTKATQPDVVAFEETDQPWIDALTKGLSATYPYHLAKVAPGSFGMSLFSRTPLDNPQVINFVDPNIPSILATINVGDKPVRVLATHPLPPWNEQYWKLRSQQVGKMVQWKSAFGDTFVLIGDLNSSSWSSDFSELRSGLNAKDSRQGFGLQLSWPAMPKAFFLSTTIDHILTSQNLRTIQRNVGPNVGSDHFPVYAVISVPQK